MILNYIKSNFKHVVVIDFEFSKPDGEIPRLVCMVARDLIHNKTKKIWLVGKKPKFPYPIDETLFVAHYSEAEVCCMLEWGLPAPKYIYDTFVEERKLMNGLVSGKGAFGLIGVCERYGIKGVMSSAKKEAWQSYIIKHYPNYPKDKAAGIISYCEEDVNNTTNLFLKQLEKLDLQQRDDFEILSQAIFHGRSMGLCAKIERNGIPVDHELFREFENNFGNIRDLEIKEANKKFDLFIKGTFNHNKFAELIKRLGLESRWPKTDLGKYKTDDKTIYRFSSTVKEMAELRNHLFIINARKLNGYQLGKDNRSRTSLKLYGQITGRTNVSTARNPFGAPRFARTFIHPSKKQVLVYADFKSQEPCIQAYLSKDPKMIAAVESGDCYLHTAKFVKAVPESATKKSYPDEREIYKTSLLAINYGQTPMGLSKKLGLPIYEATKIYETINKTYSVYGDWISGVIAKSMQRKYFETIYGWKYHISPKVRINARRLRNWPIQSCGSEIIRRTMIDVDETGIEISMIVHDAILVHVPRKNFAKTIINLKKTMENSAKKVIGQAIPVETKIIRRHFKQEGIHEEKWKQLYSKYSQAKEVYQKTDKLSAN